MNRLINTTSILGSLSLAILALALLIFSPKKLTYLEYSPSDSFTPFRSGDATAMACADESGEAPYDILSYITLDIQPGAPLPDKAMLCDRNGKTLCELGRQVLADNSATVDGDADLAESENAPSSTVLFRIPTLKRPSSSNDTCLLILDAEGRPYDLAAITGHTWYGGASEPFWRWLAGFGLAFALIFLGRVLYLIRKNGTPLGDGLLAAMALFAVTFAILSVLSSEIFPTVLDENDNIIGGMLQAANGRVLYRDYITQHTPFVYWLCAIFAKAGAKSVGQFRLLFAMVYAGVCAVIFYRHRTRIFAPAIVLFAVFSGPLMNLLIPGNAGQVLSDTVQALAMAVMLLELLGYYEDHRIDAGRAVVISLCIFAAVGSAFMAVYSVFACMVAVIAEEIRYFKGQSKETSYFLRRYLLLVGIVLVPWAAAFVYLLMNGALLDAFDMAYRFNLEVYSHYTGMTTNKLAPLYMGILLIRDLLVSTWKNLLAGKAILARVVECCMILVGLGLFGRSFKRRGAVQTLGLFFFIETQGSRAVVQFHSIMLWMVVFLFILEELPGMDFKLFQSTAKKHLDGADGTDGAGSADRDENEDSAKLGNVSGPEGGEYTKSGKRSSGHSRGRWLPVGYVAALVLIFGLPFMRMTGNVLRYRIQPVPARDMTVVMLTEAGEDVFIDAGDLRTNYVFYKYRKPLTRLLWTLPWYYEWYEEETAEALEECLPRVAVYYPGGEVWGVEDFSGETDRVIEENYYLYADECIYVRRE